MSYSVKIKEIYWSNEQHIKLSLDSNFVIKNDVLVTEGGERILATINPIQIGLQEYLYEFKPIVNITSSSNFVPLFVGESLYVVQSTYQEEHKWKQLKTLLEKL